MMTLCMCDYFREIHLLGLNKNGSRHNDHGKCGSQGKTS